MIQTKNNITAKEHYEVFVSLHGDKVSYSQYSKILRDINKELLKLLIDGKTIRIGNNLGVLKVVSIARTNFTQPNFGESNKLKQQIIDRGEVPRDKNNPDGKDWLVYFTDDRYLTFRWEKWTTNIEKNIYRATNSTSYNFSVMRDAGRSLGNNRDKNLIEMTYEHKSY